MNQWLIAWRNLMRRKTRTWLTVLSIVIGVASTFAVIAAVESAEKTFPVYLKAAFGKADFSISGTEAYFSEEVYDKARKLGGAESVAVLSGSAQLDYEQEGLTGIQKRVKLTGYSDLSTRLTDFKLIDGSLNGEGAVITDRSAEVWNKQVGDTISFTTDEGVKELKITGIVKYTKELMGPSSWTMAKYHHWSVAVPLEVVQDWFGLGGKIQAIQVKDEDGVRLGELEQQIESLVAKSEGTFMQPIVIDMEAQSETMDTFFMTLYIAGFLGIALSAFIIFNSLYVSIRERKNEFAVMKTIGFTPGQVQAMVLFEVILLSILGTLLGLLAGSGLAIALKKLIFMIYGIQDGGALLFSKGLAVSVLAGLLVPVLAAWHPIRKAGSISVIEVLKETKAQQSALNKWLGAAGIAFIAASFLIKDLLLVAPLMIGIVLVFPFLFKAVAYILKPVYTFLFGFTGDMAMRNLNRNLGRTAMTSVVLAMGLAMIVLMASLNSALLQTYERIIFASYGGNLDVMLHHIEKDDLEKLKAAEGVADAETYSLHAAVWVHEGQKRRLPVFGAGEEWIDRFPLFDADKGAHSKLIGSLQDDEIVLDRISYKSWGGKVGETLALETIDGVKKFKVAAVVDTMKNSGYSGFMEEESFQKHFGIKYERNALVIKDETISPVQLRENVFGLFGERIEEMFGPEDWVSVIGASFTGSFTIINALVVLAIIVSGIGITNTLLINIMERIRELGMMRAVGITRGQVIRMILLEGFGIGLAATLIGTAFGILLIYMTSTFMEVGSLTFEFGVTWWIIGLIGVFGILVSLISSFSPAKRASKTRLSEALRYE